MSKAVFRVAHTGHVGTVSTCGCKAKPQATGTTCPSPSPDALGDAIRAARAPEPREVALVKGLQISPAIGDAPVVATPAPTTTAAPDMAAAVRAARK